MDLESDALSIVPPRHQNEVLNSVFSASELANEVLILVLFGYLTAFRFHDTKLIFKYDIIRKQHNTGISIQQRIGF